MSESSNPCMFFSISVPFSFLLFCLRPLLPYHYCLKSVVSGLLTVNTEHKFSLSSSPVTPPAQRVQFILGQESQDVEHESHPVFSEMEELYVGEDGNMEWKETARLYICSNKS